MCQSAKEKSPSFFLHEALHDTLFVFAVPGVESIHWGVETGLSAQMDGGRLMYGVSTHLCSAGLDKTSVGICHLNISAGAPQRHKAAQKTLVQCSNERKSEECF